MVIKNLAKGMILQVGSHMGYISLLRKFKDYRQLSRKNGTEGKLFDEVNVKLFSAIWNPRNQCNHSDSLYRWRTSLSELDDTSVDSKTTQICLILCILKATPGPFSWKGHKSDTKKPSLIGWPMNAMTGIWTHQALIGGNQDVFFVEHLGPSVFSFYVWTTTAMGPPYKGHIAYA